MLNYFWKAPLRGLGSALRHLCWSFLYEFGSFLLVFCMQGFELHHRNTREVGGLKYSEKFVKCRGNVGCVCGGHYWWVSYVLLLCGAELEMPLPQSWHVHGVTSCVALSCFVMVAHGSYYCNYFLACVHVPHHHCALSCANLRSGVYGEFRRRRLGYS